MKRKEELLLYTSDMVQGPLTIIVLDNYTCAEEGERVTVSLKVVPASFIVTLTTKLSVSSDGPFTIMGIVTDIEFPEKELKVYKVHGGGLIVTIPETGQTH